MATPRYKAKILLGYGSFWPRVLKKRREVTYYWALRENSSSCKDRSLLFLPSGLKLSAVFYRVCVAPRQSSFSALRDPKTKWGVLLLRGQDKSDFFILSFRKRDVTIVPCGVKLMSPKTEGGVLLLRGQDKANFYFLLKGQRFPQGQEKGMLLLFPSGAKPQKRVRDLKGRKLICLSFFLWVLGASDFPPSPVGTLASRRGESPRRARELCA
jgi:hypothetical protein